MAGHDEWPCPCQHNIIPLKCSSTTELPPWSRWLPVHHNPHHYKLLKLIEANPAIQQREMAKAMGVSLGKANYCLQALVQKGLVKMDNFRRNDSKLGYLYVLTPSGIEAKASLTVAFLKYKIAEYEAIRDEIEELQRDLGRDATI